jgi:hypothetical protein
MYVYGWLTVAWRERAKYFVYINLKSIYNANIYPHAWIKRNLFVCFGKSLELIWIWSRFARLFSASEGTIRYVCVCIAKLLLSTRCSLPSSGLDPFSLSLVQSLRTHLMWNDLWQEGDRRDTTFYGRRWSSKSVLFLISGNPHISIQ